MADTQNNGRADFYLKIIGVLVCILMGILSWVTLNAISSNEVAHNDIKQMIVQMSTANHDRVRNLEKRFNDWCSLAPPLHEHLPDGTITKRVR